MVSILPSSKGEWTNSDLLARHRVDSKPNFVDSQVTYRIEGNFRGAKCSWFPWLKVWPQIFTHEWSDLAYLYLHAATTKILSTNILSPENYPLYGKQKELPKLKFTNVHTIITLIIKSMKTLHQRGTQQAPSGRDSINQGTSVCLLRYHGNRERKNML